MNTSLRFISGLLSHEVNPVQLLFFFACFSGLELSAGPRVGELIEFTLQGPRDVPRRDTGTDPARRAKSAREALFR
jgi:hypothetical protein